MAEDQNKPAPRGGRAKTIIATVIVTLVVFIAVVALVNGLGVGVNTQFEPIKTQLR